MRNAKYGINIIMKINNNKSIELMKKNVKKRSINSLKYNLGKLMKIKLETKLRLKLMKLIKNIMKKLKINQIHKKNFFSHKFIDKLINW